MLRQAFFCIGAAKTGTTILARMLDQQPDVACLWEAFFFHPTHEASILNPDTNKFGRHGLSLDRVRQWQERATVRVGSGRHARLGIRDARVGREIMTEVLTEFGELAGATVVGDKWPGYHRQLDLLTAAFPDAKLIYNVRDPRGVWNSGETFRDRGRGDKHLDEMLKADAAVRSHLADDQFLTLRYEDLIAQPRQTMQRVAAFVGFEFDAAAIDYERENDPFPRRWYWVPTAKGDLDVALTEKWRHEMALTTQRLVTERCAEFIERYGYDAAVE